MLVMTLYLDWERLSRSRPSAMVRMTMTNPTPEEALSLLRERAYEPGPSSDVPAFDGTELESERQQCEEMFRRYNADDRPDGQIRRSMSVGDVCVIGAHFYLCKRTGWELLPSQP